MPSTGRETASRRMLVITLQRLDQEWHMLPLLSSTGENDVTSPNHTGGGAVYDRGEMLLLANY